MLIQDIRKISISKISLRQNSFFNQSSRVLFYRPSVDSVPIGNKYFVMCMLKLRKATIKYDNYWILHFDSRDSRNPETVRFTRLRNRAGTVPTLLKRSIAREISLAIAETILPRMRKRCKTFDRTTFLRITICIYFRRNVSVNISGEMREMMWILYYDLTGNDRKYVYFINANNDWLRIG